MYGELIKYQYIMKEFSQIIKIIPVSSVPESFSGSPEELLSNQDLISVLAEHFVLDPKLERSATGSLFNCDMTHLIDTPDTDYYAIPRSALVIYAAGDNLYVVGTPDIPAMVAIQKHLQKSRLEITCKMLNNPISQ